MSTEKTRYQPYELVSEYLKGKPTAEEVKAIDNLEVQFGFSLDSAVIKKVEAKPISVKEGAERHDVSKLECVRHKVLYAYAEQHTFTLIAGKLFKRVR